MKPQFIGHKKKKKKKKKKKLPLSLKGNHNARQDPLNAIIRLECAVDGTPSQIPTLVANSMAARWTCAPTSLP